MHYAVSYMTFSSTIYIVVASFVLQLCLEPAASMADERDNVWTGYSIAPRVRRTCLCCVRYCRRLALLQSDHEVRIVASLFPHQSLHAPAFVAFQSGRVLIL